MRVNKYARDERLNTLNYKQLMEEIPNNHLECINLAYDINIK